MVAWVTHADFVPVRGALTEGGRVPHPHLYCVMSVHVFQISCSALICLYGATSVVVFVSCCQSRTK